ncbi:hypothetical protein ZYGR_0AG01350 [Zygosaccharomyces rouxii]|uniref:Zn(2)-C6 fungal-type domain-containing protein n=1 Tax=Zygosaccharomyces rouxii TaxID=4956 RepID=A0A1Q3A8T8_ZYGRO|nr:hypothetical protein ZYGR_0AG01350 [Zygosaccharomyces rouxii]
MNYSPQVKGEEKRLEKLPLKRSSSHDPTVSVSEGSKKLQRCKSEEVQFPVTASSSSDVPIPNMPSYVNNQSSLSNNHYNNSSQHSSTGHRPVTSCTHCRQHKIKCNASDNFPGPCLRCERMGLNCQIDPQFRPKKGSQLQNLRRDVDELKLKIEYLTRNEGLFAKALQQSSMGQELINTLKTIDVSKVNESANNQLPQKLQQRPLRMAPQHGKVSVQTYLGSSKPHLLQEDSNGESVSNSTGNVYKKDIPLVLQMALQRNRNMTGTDSSSDNDNVDHNTPGSQKASPSLSPGSSTYGGLKRHGTGGTANSQDNAPLLMQNIQNTTGNDNKNINDTNDDYDGNRTNGGSCEANGKKSPVVATTNAIPLLPSSHAGIDEFVIGDVRISIEKANELHEIFVTRFLPYFPIMYTNNAAELYSQSQLLFWTVMLTACLSDPEPSLYSKLAALIKQLAIETCWIRTPRSTHVTQALLILSIWPLPNQKVLDDCSYRFVGLAKCLSYQLGLHRGEFISEFTRTQTSMPDAEKWRTRTWLGVFFAELCWASVLGLPPTSQTDYLVEDARMGVEEDESPSQVKKETNTFDDNKFQSGNDNFKINDNYDNKHNKTSGSEKTKLPKNFRRLICLAHFQAKLCRVMGSSVVSPDGLMEPRGRATSLSILERELERLDRALNFGQDTAVYIYYLYVKLMVCCFAFLPGTPVEDQSQYVTEAYLCATKVVTLLVKLLEKQQLIELPIYIRQSATYAALILFKLQLTPLLLNRYLDSARQSIVTVHRLFRNQLSAWATAVENDISRTASVLEKLNFVLITHPTVFVEEDGIISRMRSHLTASLFYDLVWCVHEARRREMDPQYNEDALKRAAVKCKARGGNSPFSASNRRLYPLPFYNQISKEDFETIIQTTPGGTTVSTLVPTKTALNNARSLAEQKKDSNGTIMEINGIPLSMLDETGSVKLEHILGNGLNSKPINGSTVAAAGSGTSMQPPTVNGSSSLPDPLTQSLNLDTSLGSNSGKTNTGFNESGIQTIPTLLQESNMQRSNSTPVQPTGGVTTAVPPATAIPTPVGSAASSSHIHQRPSNANSLFNTHNSSFPSSLNRSLTPVQEKYPTNSNSSNIISTNNSAEGNHGNAGAKVNLDNYANLNLFLNANQPAPAPTNNSNTSATVNVNGIPNIPIEQRNSMGQLSELDTFFQQQSTGWLEGNSSNDDFLGWFDMDMEQKF